MKAISIRQPFVEQILAGVKTREFRSRACNMRGCFLVHAAQKAEAGGEGLPLGCLVGIADVTDCEFDEAAGCFAWVLAQPLRFARPIPFRGKVGWFEVPLEVVAAELEAAEVSFT